MDMCGFPKDNFFLLPGMSGRAKPVLHLFRNETGRWREGQEIEVWVALAIWTA